MQLPPKANPGDPISAKAWNLMIDYLRSLTPQPTSGARMFHGPSGTSYKPKRQPRSQPGTIEVLPLQLIVAPSTTVAGPSPVTTYNIRIAQSTVAGDNLIAEGYFHYADDPPAIIALTGKGPGDNGVIIAEIDIDDAGDGSIVDGGVSIYSDDTYHQATTDDRIAGNYFIAIGTWSISTAGVLSVSNSRYGPINIVIYRDYFAAAAPFYNLVVTY